MNKLADLEICKRIAEIEGLMFCTGNRYARIEIWLDGKVYKYKKFNPLTDDALCFKLMVKYEVSLTYGDYAVNAEILIEREGGDYSFTSQAYCPKRAICLAIIKSKDSKQWT